jgi:hypothetical protein
LKVIDGAQSVGRGIASTNLSKSRSDDFLVTIPLVIAGSGLKLEGKIMSHHVERHAHRALMGRPLSDLAQLRHWLTERETTLLAQYGAWMEALAAGRIAPLTAAQKRFKQVDQRKLAASSPYEQAWRKVQTLRDKHIRGGREDKPMMPPRYRHHSRVCPSCGMVDDNCLCGRD